MPRAAQHPDRLRDTPDARRPTPRCHHGQPVRGPAGAGGAAMDHAESDRVAVGDLDRRPPVRHINDQRFCHPLVQFRGGMSRAEYRRTTARRRYAGGLRAYPVPVARQISLPHGGACSLSRYVAARDGAMVEARAAVCGVEYPRDCGMTTSQVLLAGGCPAGPSMVSAGERAGEGVLDDVARVQAGAMPPPLVMVYRPLDCWIPAQSGPRFQAAGPAVTLVRVFRRRGIARRSVSPRRSGPNLGPERRG
jgi:hypothetical protein